MFRRKKRRRKNVGGPVGLTSLLHLIRFLVQESHSAAFAPRLSPKMTAPASGPTVVTRNHPQPRRGSPLRRLLRKAPRVVPALHAMPRHIAPRGFWGSGNVSGTLWSLRVGVFWRVITRCWDWIKGTPKGIQLFWEVLVGCWPPGS